MSKVGGKRRHTIIRIFLLNLNAVAEGRSLWSRSRDAEMSMKSCWGLSPLLSTFYLLPLPDLTRMNSRRLLATLVWAFTSFYAWLSPFRLLLLLILISSTRGRKARWLRILNSYGNDVWLELSDYWWRSRSWRSVLTEIQSTPSKDPRGLSSKLCRSRVPDM